MPQGDVEMNKRTQYKECFRIWRRVMHWSDYSNEGWLNLQCLRNRLWRFDHDVVWAARKAVG